MLKLMNMKLLNVKLYFWFCFLISSLIFIFFPEIDIFITQLFYNGKIFPLNNTLFDYMFYYSVGPILIVLILSAIIIFLYNVITKKNILNINKKVIIFLILSLSIAPGLIVNEMLKNNWGRARPGQTVNFGGEKKFTSAFVVTNQGGYSFSSGHVAAATSFIAFALIAKRNRKFWITLSLVYIFLVSVARIAVGGHFFSDVMTSFFIVYIFTYYFYGLLIEKKTKSN